MPREIQRTRYTVGSTNTTYDVVYAVVSEEAALYFLSPNDSDVTAPEHALAIITAIQSNSQQKWVELDYYAVTSSDGGLLLYQHNLPGGQLPALTLDYFNEFTLIDPDEINEVDLMQQLHKTSGLWITHTRYNRVNLLSLEGRLRAADAVQLKLELDQLLDAGRFRIVIDLARLEDSSDGISSPGLRVLMEARKRARDWKLTDLEGGDVRLASLPKGIKQIFDMTGFTSLFEIYESTVDAVGSF